MREFIFLFYIWFIENFVFISDMKKSPQEGHLVQEENHKIRISKG